MTVTVALCTSTSISAPEIPQAYSSGSAPASTPTGAVTGSSAPRGKNKTHSHGCGEADRVHASPRPAHSSACSADRSASRESALSPPVLTLPAAPPSPEACAALAPPEA
eukprot:scaffold34081_cov73-Isochrysis_galbana.AAC.1